MATPLKTAVHREVTIEVAHGKFETYVVSLCPADEVERFPTIKFRLKGRKFKYSTPMQSHLYHAASKHLAWEVKEKKRLKKERKALREAGML